MNPAFRTVNPITFSCKLAVLAVVSIGGVYLAQSESTPLSLLGILVLGCMMAHAVELQHQCVHDAAFQTKWLNSIFGVALGLPMLTSFHRYRRHHLRHHRHLGTARDRAFFSYASSTELGWRAIAKDASGLSHLLQAARNIFAAVRMIAVKPTALTAEGLNYLLMGALLISVVLLSIAAQSWDVVQIWFLSLLLIALPVHFLIELPEHLFCGVGTRDVFQNTRTIMGSPASRWFTNGNNFHVEHHFYPNVPPERLVSISQHLLGRHRHIHATYAEFYALVLRRLITTRGAHLSRDPKEGLV